MRAGLAGGIDVEKAGDADQQDREQYLRRGGPRLKLSALAAMPITSPSRITAYSGRS